MTEQSRNRHWRPALPWLLSLALVGAYVALGGEDKPERGSGGIAAPGKGSEKPSDDGKLEILEINPGQPTTGGAVEIHFAGANPNNADSLRAFLSGKEEATFIQQRGDRLMVRLPQATRAGRNKIRIQQGSDEERHSKPYDLPIKTPDRRGQLRTIIGGLALLIFGLRTMSGGSRRYTGLDNTGLLARVGRRPPTAAALGAAMGGVTQFTTVAAGLVVGLVESHVLAVAPAVAMLIGAQFGAAAAPSVMVLASTKEGLFVVAIGVLWLILSRDRRSEAFAKILLGCGLLFYGLHILRDGFQPLVSDPAILPYLDRFSADSVSGTLACVTAGMLLALLLQGPTPVYVLVLGVAQSSGHVNVNVGSALAILAGTGLGAAFGTGLVASPFGPDARRVARIHLALALIGTIVLAATVGLWAFLAARLLPGTPGADTQGREILIPQVGGHLFVAFALSQLSVAIVLVAAIGPVSKLLDRLFTRGQRTRSGTLSGADGITTLRTGLGRVLGNYKAALGGIRDLSLTGNREKGRTCEHTLADAREDLEGLFTSAVRTQSDDPGLPGLQQAALSGVQLQRSLEDLLRNVERTTEKKIALAPPGAATPLGAQDEATIKALVGLLDEGLDALITYLTTGEAPDVDAARAREIRLNAMESEARQSLLTRVGQADANGARGDDIALRLANTDLINAFESVGNHMYRLSEALAADVDQLD